jgi:L-lactate dehydrogenase complex protein LldG
LKPERFFDGLRRAIAAGAGPIPAPAARFDRLPAKRQAGGRSADRPDPESLWHRLTAAAGEVNLVVRRFDTPQDGGQALAALARERSPEWSAQKSVVAWDHPLVAALALDNRLSPTGIPVVVAPSGPAGPAAAAAERQRWRRAAQRALIGVTGADYCLADTATLVLRSGPGRPRLASLLPTIHVAVIRPDQLIADLGALLALLDGSAPLGPGGLSGCMNLVTGPSRTRDIEAVMVYGAHGPREVHLYVIAGKG